MTEPGRRKPPEPLVFTYEEDLFTFRNRAMQCWLLGVTAAAILLAIFAPPAFWLCGAGAALVVVASLAHSARTGKWTTPPYEHEPANWFEGWAGCTGAILLIVPILNILLRT